MSFNNIPPRWDAQGKEPDEKLQESGFVAGYKPPAQYFNYMFHEYTESIKELQEAETALEETVETEAGKLSSHTSDTTAHITADERTKWNDADDKKHEHDNKSILDKITQALLDNWSAAYTHISDAVKHITSAERTLWNTVSNKVDKVTGKGLSANDFTDELLTKLNGVEAGANKYTHPAYAAKVSGLYKVTVDGTGHVSVVTPVTKADITALGIPGQDTNTEYSTMTGASSSAAGKSGLVPAPVAGNNDEFLRGDGTWATPKDTTYGVATSDKPGLVKSGTDITIDSSGNVTVNDDSHAHVISNVDGLQAALDGKAVASHGTHVPSACTTITDWNNATTTGWYMGSGAANNPTGSATAWFMGYVVAHNTNYVYQEVYQFTASADAKAIPKYIRAKTSGTWGAWTNVTVAKAVPSDAVFTDNDTKYSNFVKSGSGAKAGLVPAPSTTEGTTKYLREDGTWQTPPDNNTTYSAATQSAQGLMSAADKKKLDGIATGAQVNSITGVKGNAESSYRTGNVNITPANIGLGNVNNTADANKSVAEAAAVVDYANTNSTVQVGYAGSGATASEALYAAVYVSGPKIKDMSFSDLASKVVNHMATQSTSITTAGTHAIDARENNASISGTLANRITALESVTTSNATNAYTGQLFKHGKIVTISSRFAYTSSHSSGVWLEISQLPSSIFYPGADVYAPAFYMSSDGKNTGATTSRVRMTGEIEVWCMTTDMYFVDMSITYLSS